MTDFRKKAESKKKPPMFTSQRQRFIETAKELEVDETGETFETAFGKIVPPKSPQEKKTE